MFPLTPQQPRRGTNTVNDMSRRSRTGRECDWFLTTGERQLEFQSRYHMGRRLTLSLCLLVVAGNNGVAFTPWVALPGDYTPDVHHPLLPGTPPCRVEASNRSTGTRRSDRGRLGGDLQSTSKHRSFREIPPLIAPTDVLLWILRRSGQGSHL
ncbi:hypothetical protein AVEN_113278-1 [Araneus ventricosus]|uniref:Uncharacterized protein n=1 Tax=Araneus ventricosus TaxID=182803 RepID=A0A4Y2JR50_ARAVE|nr:hypothetical protein AVEN_113278-1 [Araneus ventricosus]